MFRFSAKALPWDRTARRDLRRWRFAPGSIGPGHAKLLRDHDYASSLGWCAFEPGETGLWLVGRTRHSVQTGQGISVRVRNAVWSGLSVVSADVEEVSIARVPAYPDCVINAVYEEE